MSPSFQDKLRELEAEYKAKAEHYDSAGDRMQSAVYWGCYTGVFYAGCAYQQSRLEDVRALEVPFDAAA